MSTDCESLYDREAAGLPVEREHAVKYPKTQEIHDDRTVALLALGALALSNSQLEVAKVQQPSMEIMPDFSTDTAVPAPLSDSVRQVELPVKP